MKGLSAARVALLQLLLASHAVSAAQEPKVLLRSIKTLTLYKDRMTSSRRVKAMPQLSCIGGSGKKHFQVDVMRCQNSGSSYDPDDVEWTCKASLPPEFKLGSTDVVCEGYAYPDDPYVLRGSCAVEYRLALTAAGEQRYGAAGLGDWFSGGGEGARNPLAERIITLLFWTLFVGVGLWIAYAFLASLFRGGGQARPRQPRRPRAGYGGGGFDDDDDDDPPPPYDAHFGAPRPRQHKPASATASTSAGSSRASRGGQSWTPGFFTGAGLGAAGAYAAGSYLERRRREEEAADRARRQQGGTGWLGNRFRQDDAGEGPSNSARYESTGFGSTRRR